MANQKTRYGQIYNTHEDIFLPSERRSVDVDDDDNNDDDDDDDNNGDDDDKPRGWLLEKILTSKEFKK